MQKKMARKLRLSFSGKPTLVFERKINYIGEECLIPNFQTRMDLGYCPGKGGELRRLYNIWSIEKVNAHLSS